MSKLKIKSINKPVNALTAWPPVFTTSDQIYFYHC